jgi:hypothetical protein
MNLAALEMPDGVFLAYIAALVVSGVILLVLSATGFGASSALVRVLNGVFGLGFLGYAVYLLFFFQGGEFPVFYYAFILPVIMLVQAFKTRAAKPDAAAQPAPGAEA